MLFKALKNNDYAKTPRFKVMVALWNIMEIIMTLNGNPSMIEPVLDFLLQPLPWDLITAKEDIVCEICLLFTKSEKDLPET